MPSNPPSARMTDPDATAQARHLADDVVSQFKRVITSTDVRSHLEALHDIVLAALTAATAAQEAIVRELAQAEHEIRTIALVEWGWPASSPRYQAMHRWAVAMRDALAILRPRGASHDESR